MSAAEMLFKRARHLPENLEAEALPDVDFLLYSPEDAIYEA
jgi:hypothetical protein